MATGSATRVGQDPHRIRGLGTPAVRSADSVSELIFAIIIIKQHLRRYISDNGVVDASFPRVEGDYVLPMHLHSLQELNTQVGRFFDEALYSVAIGYEERARSGASQDLAESQKTLTAR